MVKKTSGRPRRAGSRPLTREQFVLQAIRSMRQKNDYNGGQMSARLKAIAGAFRLHFGERIDRTVDRMIKKRSVWAVRTTYKPDGHRSRLASAEVLASFPDPNVETDNPTLYPKDELPPRMRGPVNRSAQLVLEKILKPAG